MIAYFLPLHPSGTSINATTHIGCTARTFWAEPRAIPDYNGESVAPKQERGIEPLIPRRVAYAITPKTTGIHGCLQHNCSSFRKERRLLLLSKVTELRTLHPDSTERGFTLGTSTLPLTYPTVQLRLCGADQPQNKGGIPDPLLCWLLSLSPHRMPLREVPLFSVEVI